MPCFMGSGVQLVSIYKVGKLIYSKGEHHEKTHILNKMVCVPVWEKVLGLFNEADADVFCIQESKLQEGRSIWNCL